MQNIVERERERERKRERKRESVSGREGAPKRRQLVGGYVSVRDDVDSRKRPADDIERFAKRARTAANSTDENSRNRKRKADTTDETERSAKRSKIVPIADCMNGLLEESKKAWRANIDRVNHCIAGLTDYVEQCLLNEDPIWKDLSNACKDNRYKTSVEGISYILFNIGNLVKNNQKQEYCAVSSISARVVAGLLGQILRREISSVEDVTRVFTSLGFLVKKMPCRLDGVLNTEILTDLLERGMNCRDVDSKFCAIAIYNLGLLSKVTKFDKRFKTAIISSFLDKLIEPRDLSTRDIANLLYGLGIMAQADNLDGEIKAEAIIAVLNKLKSQNYNAQDIANVLYGLGLIAKAGILDGQISDEVVIQFLDKLVELADCSPQGITNTLYGLGFLAQANKIDGRINANAIIRVLNKLMSKNYNALHIGDTLYSLGLIAKAGILDGKIPVEIFLVLLKKLVELDDCNPLRISNTLYGLGFLVQANNVDGRINANVIIKVLNKLMSEDYKEQDIANMFYSLGLIAKAGVLDGKIPVEILLPFLGTLVELDDCGPQGISNTLYGLGFLAQANNLKGLFPVEILSRTLGKLVEFDNCSAQHLSLALYSFGLIAQRGMMDKRVCVKNVNRLLSRLIETDDYTSQNIVNTLSGLAHLLQADKLDGPLDSNMLDILVSRAWVSSLNHSDADYFLYALTPLFSLGYRPSTLTAQNVRALFENAISRGYIHPIKAASHINSIVVFREFHEVLHVFFEELLLSLAIPYDKFSPERQKQFDTDLEKLSDVPKWKELLQKQLGLANQEEQNCVFPDQSSPASLPSCSPLQGSVTLPVSAETGKRTTPAPVRGRVHPRLDGKRKLATVASSVMREPIAGWDEAVAGDTLFGLISRKDSTGLIKFLGVNLRRHYAPRSGDGNASRAAVSVIERLRAGEHDLGSSNKQHKKDDINTLVRNFLERTPVKLLYTLISSSDALCFKVLLHACTNHTRYSLAIDNVLHPIIGQLAFAELENMISAFIELQFYCDNTALRRLVNALQIRRLVSNPEEASAIKGYQKILLDRSIKFHASSNHIYVVPVLERELKRIEKIYLHEEEEGDEVVIESLASDVVSAQPAKSKSTTGSKASSVGLFGAGAKTKPNTKLTNYQYIDSDIERILRARLRDLENVYVFAGANMSTGAEGNMVEDVLQQHAEYAPENLEMWTKQLQPGSEFRVVIPIVQNEHWVGVMLHVRNENGNKTASISYYDSLKRDGQDAFKLQLLTKVTSFLRAFSIQAKSLTPWDKCKIQLDGTSCGPYLIENIYCHITNKNWNQPDPTLAKMFREKHVSVLEERDPEYAEGFKQRLGIDQNRRQEQRSGNSVNLGQSM